MKQLKKFITRKSLFTLLGIILFLGIWSIISVCVDEHQMIFPGPIATIEEVFNILSKSTVYKHILSSVVRLLIGFSIGLLVSMILGVIAGNNRDFRILISPLITAMKSIPTASLVFLFLVIFGASETPIVMVSLISFPILYDSIVGGIDNLDEEVKDAMKVDSGSKIRNVFKVQLPLLVPYFIVGVSSSLALSFKIEIMSEILTGDTRSGLGCAILGAQRNDPVNMVPIFAYSLIAILLAVIFDLIFKFIKKKINYKE